MQPKSLHLLGLAIAIALWGFGYRLSTYELHPNSNARGGAAKLCLEPRNASFMLAARIKSSAHLIPVSAAIPASARFFPHMECVLACVIPQTTPRPASLRFLIPFRSPPPLNLPLA
jgi:hypothetical protein